MLDTLGIGGMERQLATNHAIALVAHMFAGSNTHCADEFVPHGVNGLGLEVEMIAVKGGFVEELINELSFVAVGLTKAGEEARKLAVLDIELNELAFLEKREHARYVVGIGSSGRRSLGARHPRQHRDQQQKTSEDHSHCQWFADHILSRNLHHCMLGRNAETANCWLRKNATGCSLQGGKFTMEK